MDSSRMINILIADGEYILKTGFRRTSYKSWYERAESTLKRVFGEDWKELVTWEGFDTQEILWSSDLGVQRLKRSITYIKSAQKLLPELVVQETLNSVDTINQSDLSRIKAFIVHGHDSNTKLELKNYLQNTLNLPEPIILHEKPNQGRTIIEKFEELAKDITLAFVLLTPDDVFVPHDDNNTKLYRARQNVIFELGYFLGLLGRKTGRVILLYKGKLDIPSDISGLVYIDISNGIESVGDLIRKEISRFV